MRVNRPSQADFFLCSHDLGASSVIFRWCITLPSSEILLTTFFRRLFLRLKGRRLGSDTMGGNGMKRNKVEICGVNTAQLPVLTNAEMRDLFQRLQSGELPAREKLVNGNLRLVLSVIQRFNNRGEYVDDLFQVGCIGLMKAIDNFDLGQNVRFSTYAVPMIIGEIRRYLRDNNPIRVSRSLRDIAYKALQVRDQLTNQHLREPTVQEISNALELPKEDVVFALDAIQDPVSLFEPIYNDGGDPIYVMDQISDDKSVDKTWVEEIALREAMRKLSDREKKILSMRFYEGKTQMEVAEEIGISQAQVSRLEKAAIHRMQKHIQV
jgi:RNA polymerase sporulation-specific sigma factor